MLKKVISGGQTGVDQSALRAAASGGLALGGWCPPGRTCATGVIPADLPLRETPNDRSPDAPNIPRSQRTEWNVRDSDGTLILTPKLQGQAADPGTEWTSRCVTRFGKPLLICDPQDPTTPERIRRWLDSLPIQTLNVAGPSEDTCPGIGGLTSSCLRKVFGGPPADHTRVVGHRPSPP